MRNKRNYTLQFNEGGIREDSSSDRYQAHFLLNFHFLVVADKKIFFVTGENTGFSKRILAAVQRPTTERLVGDSNCG